MSKKIFLIVGSESGTAEMVGDCVRDALVELGVDVETYTQDAGTSATELMTSHPVVLLCCSSTGIGDLPQNVEPLYDDLRAQRPDLAQLRYGVIGLGDRNYKDSYLGGPKKWDSLLTELGAKRVGEMLALDATDNPEPDTDAVNWVKGWVGSI